MAIGTCISHEDPSIYMFLPKQVHAMRFVYIVTVQLQGFFNFPLIPVGNKTDWND